MCTAAGRTKANGFGLAWFAGALVLALSATASAQVLLDGPHLIGPGSTIGVTVTELSGRSDDAGATSGVRIERVHEGTPAARAKLQAGDIIVEFDGIRVRSVRQFTRVVQETPPNRAVDAIVLRDGARQTVSVTPELGRAAREPLVRIRPFEIPRLGPLPFASPDRRGVLPAPATRVGLRLGATVVAVEPQLAEHLGVESGVLVMSVDPDSPAAAAGIRAGDVITRAGDRDVRTASDLDAAIRAAGQGASLDLRITRDRKELDVRATLPEAGAGASGDRFRV